MSEIQTSVLYVCVCKEGENCCHNTYLLVSVDVLFVFVRLLRKRKEKARKSGEEDLGE